MIISNIKQIMNQKKITIRALCSTTDLSLETICRARDERFVTCTVVTLEAIAKALGVKVKDLFDEIPDPPAGAE